MVINNNANNCRMEGIDFNIKERDFRLVDIQNQNPKLQFLSRVVILNIPLEIIEGLNHIHASLCNRSRALDL